MSNIRAITSALAALIVTYTNEALVSVTPTAYDINAVPPSVPAANLPVRLLGTTRGGSGATFSPFTAGVSDGRVEHDISELCLLEAVGLSRVQDEWCDTMRYMDALLAKLQASRSIYTRCEITSVNAQRGVYEWPSQSNEFFYGCQTSITILEYQ